MAKYANPLNNIKIASPCSADWNEMIGNERKRYCGDCKLNVYNLSEMTKAQAENLIIESEGNLCVRFYRRSDGTVLTQDCPVGWQKIKNRTKVFVTAAASIVFSFLGAIGLNSLVSKNAMLNSAGSAPRTNEAAPINSNVPSEYDRNPFATMGNFMIPPENKRTTMSNGGMSNLNELKHEIISSRER